MPTLPTPNLPGMRRASGPALIFVLAGAAALLAGLIVFRIAAAQGARVPVVVAKKEIPAYTQVTPEMLAVVPLPPAAVPNGALRDPAQAAGKWTRRIFLPGDVVREGHLSDHGGQGGMLAERLADKKDGRPDGRAVSIPVEYSPGIAARIQPGDRIDVLAYLRDTPGQPGAPGAAQAAPTAQPKAEPRVVATGALVLDVVLPEQDAGQPDGGQGRGDMRGGEVVVAVAPEEALAILEGMAQGRLLFALVPAGAESSAPGGQAPQQAAPQQAGGVPGS